MPISPVLAWGAPTDTFNLFDGPMRYRAGQLVSPPLEGAVQLVLRAGVHLHWSLDVETWQKRDDEVWDFWSVDDESESIELVFMGKSLSLPVAQTSQGRGFVMRRPEQGEPTELLHHVIAHWVNLPGIEIDGTFVLGAWKCRISPRPDLRDAFKSAKAQYLNIGTHVMEVSSVEGGCFLPSSVAEFLTGLQFGVSFALSRWVAPIMPIGFAEDGEVIWSEWLAWRIDPPMYGSGRWWVEHRPQDLLDFLSVWMDSWQDPQKRVHLRFLVTSAIASGDGTFVEQRLMTTLAGIEKISWISDVLSGKRTEKWWRARNSHQRIRNLLTEASVPIHLDPKLTPALCDYAEEHDLGDGPLAVVSVRDRITHPKNTEPLYLRPGLIPETARLTRKYLDLLILHYLGYQGRYSDRTRIRGWVGDSEVVPWARVR